MTHKGEFTIVQLNLRIIVRNRILTLLCALELTLLALPVAAQEIKPARLLTVPPAEVRTAPDFEPSVVSPEEPVEEPFRPTMEHREYTKLKAEADQAANSENGLFQMLTGSTGFVPDSATTPTVVINSTFEGLNQIESGGTVLPDLHGAAGRNQFVQVVNSRLAVFNKATGNQVGSVTLNTFFGYQGAPLVQPRVVYDREQARWIVTARATPEGTSTQFFFIGVSRTEDATGEFFINRINVRASPFSPDATFDYPQIGIDNNAVIITANIFSTPSGPLPGPPSITDPFRGASMFAIPKNSLYNGAGFTVKLFTELTGTLTPPIVLDDNPTSFLIANLPRTPLVALYALTNSGDPDNSTLDVSAVNVGFYNLPRSARQPGAFTPIDTLDTRFVNASTQIGDSLFNIHTINFSGFATPRWYELNTATNRVIQSGTFFGTATSDDFNASLVVNDDKDMFATWNSTSELTSRDGQAYLPQIRISGRLHTDPRVDLSGLIVFQSGDSSSRFAWGGYSAITIDPSEPKCAWGVNEKVNQPFAWGSRNFSICFPE